MMEEKKYYKVQFTEKRLGYAFEVMRIVADSASDALAKAEKITDREVRSVTLGGEVYV